jgi:hypothetical protein
MPIIINELVVKATFADAAEENDAARTDGTATVDRQAMVEECVEEVMKILQRQNER